MKPVGIAWQKGQELPVVTLPPVTRLQLIKYAGASGDFNPIHTIDEAAEQAGLPGVIAHGMLTMATMGRLFTPYLDRGFIQRFYTRFVDMVFVGDVLTIGGKVVETRSTEEGELISFDVFAKNQKEQVVARGSVDFLLFREWKTQTMA
jgi:acyl dehydratase